MARFVFELCHPKHLQVFNEGEENEVKFPHTVAIKVNLSLSEKSNFVKLFKQLNWKQEAVHPAQLLGDAFLCEVTHGWDKGQDPKKDKPKYANLKKDGVFTFSAPRQVDALSGAVTEIAVPALHGGDTSRKIFLFDNPTIETWDSLYIEGTYERDGKEISKNWIQETILASTDFPGSKLEEILAAGMDEGLGELPTENPADQEQVQDPLAGMGL